MPFNMAYISTKKERKKIVQNSELVRRRKTKNEVREKEKPEEVSEKMAETQKEPKDSMILENEMVLESSSTVAEIGEAKMNEESLHKAKMEENSVLKKRTPLSGSSISSSIEREFCSKLSNEKSKMKKIKKKELRKPTRKLKEGPAMKPSRSRRRSRQKDSSESSCFSSFYSSSSIEEKQRKTRKRHKRKQNKKKYERKSDSSSSSSSSSSDKRRYSLKELKQKEEIIRLEKEIMELRLKNMELAEAQRAANNNQTNPNGPSYFMLQHQEQPIYYRNPNYQMSNEETGLIEKQTKMMKKGKRIKGELHSVEATERHRGELQRESIMEIESQNTQNISFKHNQPDHGIKKGNFTSKGDIGSQESEESIQYIDEKTKGTIERERVGSQKGEEKSSVQSQNSVISAWYAASLYQKGLNEIKPSILGRENIEDCVTVLPEDEVTNRTKKAEKTNLLMISHSKNQNESETPIQTPRNLEKETNLKRGKRQKNQKPSLQIIQNADLSHDLQVPRLPPAQNTTIPPQTLSSFPPPPIQANQPSQIKKGRGRSQNNPVDEFKGFFRIVSNSFKKDQGRTRAIKGEPGFSSLNFSVDGSKPNFKKECLSLWDNHLNSNSQANDPRNVSFRIEKETFLV